MPRSAVSQVCMWALTRPGITILSVASMVSSAVALRLRPAALMVLPEMSSSPPFISPIAGSSVTSQPHLISVDFMDAVSLTCPITKGRAQTYAADAAANSSAFAEAAFRLGYHPANHPSHAVDGAGDRLFSHTAQLSFERTTRSSQRGGMVGPILAKAGSHNTA